MILTHAALIALAAGCISPKEIAPIVVGMVEHENPQRDTMAVQYNSNGTVDYGLGQINSSNFPMLTRLFGQEVNANNIRANICLNLRASQAILFVRYNGNPSAAVGANYARGAMASVERASTDFLIAAPGTTATTGARQSTPTGPDRDGTGTDRPGAAGVRNPAAGSDGDLSDEPEGVSSTTPGDDK